MVGPLLKMFLLLLTSSVFPDEPPHIEIINATCEANSKSASISFVGTANHSYYLLFEVLSKGIVVRDAVDAPNNFRPMISRKYEGIEASQGDVFRVTVTCENTGKSHTWKGELPKKPCQ